MFFMAGSGCMKFGGAQSCLCHCADSGSCVFVFDLIKIRGSPVEPIHQFCGRGTIHLDQDNPLIYHISRILEWWSLALLVPCNRDQIHLLLHVCPMWYHTVHQSQPTPHLLPTLSPLFSHPHVLIPSPSHSHLPLSYQSPASSFSVSPKIFLPFLDNHTLQSTFISLAPREKDTCTSRSWWSQVNTADDPVFAILYGFCQEVGRKATSLDISANKIVSGFSLSDISALVVRKQDNQKLIILPIFACKASYCLISTIFNGVFYIFIINIYQLKVIGCARLWVYILFSLQSLKIF